MLGARTEADLGSVGTGYQPVETEVACVVTRFCLRSSWALLRFWLWYRRVREDSKQIEGLLASSFFVENARTCATFSLWRDARSIAQFNARVFSHVHAANSSFKDVLFESSGPLIWSAQFKLSAVSPHNLRWKGVDLRDSLSGPITRHSQGTE